NFHAPYSRYEFTPRSETSGVFSSREVAASRHLARRVPRGPGPLEVVAAQPAGDVHHFADEVQAGHELRLHRAGREPVGVHTAQGHLGGAVTLGAAGDDRPVVQSPTDLMQLGVAVLAHGATFEPQL